MPKDPVYRAELRLRGQMNIGLGIFLMAVGLGFVFLAPMNGNGSGHLGALAMAAFGLFAVYCGVDQKRQADSEE